LFTLRGIDAGESYPVTVTIGFEDDRIAVDHPDDLAG
jgi:hypothetical protein